MISCQDLAFPDFAQVSWEFSGFSHFRKAFRNFVQISKACEKTCRVMNKQKKITKNILYEWFGKIFCSRIFPARALKLHSFTIVPEILLALLIFAKLATIFGKVLLKVIQANLQKNIEKESWQKARFIFFMFFRKRCVFCFKLLGLSNLILSWWIVFYKFDVSRPT